MLADLLSKSDAPHRLRDISEDSSDSRQGMTVPFERFADRSSDDFRGVVDPCSSTMIFPGVSSPPARADAHSLAQLSKGLSFRFA